MSGSGRASLGANSEGESDNTYASQIRGGGVRLSRGKGISGGVRREVGRIEEREAARTRSPAAKSSGERGETSRPRAQQRTAGGKGPPSGGKRLGHNINGRSDYWASQRDPEPGSLEGAQDQEEAEDEADLDDGATEQVAGKEDGEVWNAMDIGHHLSIQTTVLESILIELGGDKETTAEDLARTPLDLLNTAVRRVKPMGKEIPPYIDREGPALARNSQ